MPGSSAHVKRVKGKDCAAASALQAHSKEMPSVRHMLGCTC